MNRLPEYVAYHVASERTGDIDPSYPMLRYVADRFELSTEQRYWVAFLYACTYCAPMAFWLYNEFPDHAHADPGRIRRWWAGNRDRTLFQSDRRWVRSRNQFSAMVESYQSITLPGQQSAFLRASERGYDPLYVWAGQVFQMGRFGLFLWLEAVHVIAGLPVIPTGIDWKHAQSSANGLCFAVGRDEWLRGNDYGDDPLPPEYSEALDRELARVIGAIRAAAPDVRADPWNVETSLCAFKKWKRGKRYVGFYRDRQHDEIAKLQAAVPHGVRWDVLWQFRQETWPPELLKEKGDFARIYWGAVIKRALHERREPVFA